MNDMAFPRIVVAGSGGSTGKTLVALGLARLFTGQGLDVRAFKKGPDYIDAAWLGRAAGKAARNLDPYFLSGPELRALFQKNAANADLSIIEGNRGLYDGRDVIGSCSTAEVARTLAAPILLVLNVTRMTRTAAALLHGLANFEPGVHMAGVILNRVGAERHCRAVIAAIEHYTDIPVLGAIPRLSPSPLAERAMGLAAGHGAEWEQAETTLDLLARVLADHVDTARLLEIARKAPGLYIEPQLAQPSPAAGSPGRPRIGYVHDEALWFYYPENLEALTQAGAELVRLSLLDPRPWPELDGLYLGGGFPEFFAERLAGSPHFSYIRALADSGAPIYAECGGAMILAEAIEIKGRQYSMAGIFPFISQSRPKPQGLGYIEARVTADNPFHPLNTVFRGHEFHYSRCRALGPCELALALSSESGKAEGMGKGADGLLHKNTFAAYTHLFAPAVPHWAGNFARAAGKAKKP